MRDWSNFMSFEPQRVLQPRSLEDLEQLLTGIARGTVQAPDLRVLGSLHSCSRICESQSVLDVGTLPKSLELAPDGSSVLVSANYTLHALLDELAVHGKSLAATGGTYHQTLAGLISTSTAPATPRVSMYDALEQVDYMTIDEAAQKAVVKSVSRGDPEFPAAVCSLGALGVLTRVKFGLIDQPFFRAVQHILDMEEILADLDATSAKYDFWRVNWIPKSERALLWAATRIPANEADPNGDYPNDAAENVLGFLFKQWDVIAHGKPGPLLDPLMDAIYKVMAVFYNLGQKPATGPLRNMLPVDKRAPLRVAMAEWSFAPADLQAVLAVCRRYFDAHGWPNIPTEIELSKTDRYFMSPWNWPELPYIVKLNFMYLVDISNTDDEKALIIEHLRGLWNELSAARIRFKAHWGKLNFLTRPFLEANYQLASFEPFIQPRFVNPYLRERLGAG